MQQITPAYLVIRHGGRWTDILRLSPKQTVTIGRSSSCTIAVREEKVSRHHALVDFGANGWQVTDLGSRNGTQIDGNTISGPYQLQEGDRIGVGNCVITYTSQLSEGIPAEHSEMGGVDSGATIDGNLQPTIVHRVRNSQWSSGGLSFPKITALESKPSLDQFFYHLVFRLVGCESSEQAAEAALNEVVDFLGIQCGGILAFKEVGGTARDIGVLATRQPHGKSYHRVSDYLVQSILGDKQAILARNIQDDRQLTAAHGSGIQAATSVICAPLRDMRQGSERIIGILHVYGLQEDRELTPNDLQVVVGVADNLAIAITQQQSKVQLQSHLESSRRQVDQLRQQLQLTYELVGEGPAIEQVRLQIGRVAPTPATVLIRGESGVGKELVARAIHAHSEVKDGPLVCLNCAALAPTLLESELFGHEKGAFTGATERKIGKFEAADGGTLLLDEIGEMHVELQAKFLRVLEGQPFERLGGNKPIHTRVRVIAATNRDLEEAVAEKTFRSDLYYRLRVIEIVVPPLRERRGDIPLLVNHFIELLKPHAGRRIAGISEDALKLLNEHSWPGNIRELRNVIERALVLGGGNTIEPRDLNLSSLHSVEGAASKQIHTAVSFLPQSLAEIEQQHIFRMLEFTEGNKSRAAQLLGIERSTLDRKLKRFPESP
ncbi:MAG: sigma 54-interacting transcriptional regulator [Planctomycetales bacterium]|nr:sigma 54-interacting transcriptional regulator [Planctomycetales bacterium]